MTTISCAGTAGYRLTGHLSCSLRERISPLVACDRFLIEEVATVHWLSQSFAELFRHEGLSCFPRAVAFCANESFFVLALVA